MRTMKLLLMISVLFLAIPARADNILTGTDLELDMLGRCRQDFSVRLCRQHPDLYKCVMFHKGNAPYLTWEQLFGDGSAKVELQRLNRRNTLVWRNHCLAMPFDFNKIVPPFPQVDARFPHGRAVIVDLKKLAWVAYENGRLVRWGAANGGSKICRETGKMKCKSPVGLRQILLLGKAGKRSDLYPIDCKDKRRCGHPMPYYMKLVSSGEGLHGDRHLVGSNASHGCIRMFKADARWMNLEFAHVGMPVFLEDY